MNKKRYLIDMDKDIFTIGEMSNLFDLSTQTLRYYDKIGLFQPLQREDNNYRVYQFEQCYQLAAICQMRSIGYPINKIKEIMDLRNVANATDEMKQRIKTINKEKQRLIEMKKAISWKLDFLESSLILYENNPEPSICSQPARYYMFIGSEDILYKDKSFYLNPTIVFYNHSAKRQFGAYLGANWQEIANETNRKNKKESIYVLPKSDYLCAYHRGSYQNIWSFVCNLRDQYSMLNLSDSSIHFNLIDQFVEKNSDNFLTQVQILIK